MNPNHPNRLSLAALLVAGVSSISHAQLNVSLPSVSWNDPLAAAGGTNPNNVIYSATATSAFLLGASVNQTNGAITRVNTNATTSSFGFRLRNSSYPGLWGDFSILTAAFVANTAGITPALRTMTGNVLGAAIPSGSTFTFEAFSSVVTGAVTGAAEATGSVDFTVNFSFAPVYGVRDTFSFTGSPITLPFAASTTAGTNTFTGTASATYVWGPSVVTNTATYQSLTSATLFSEVRVTAYNSGYPSLVASFRPWPAGTNSGNLVGTDLTFSGLGGTVSGTMAGALISAGSTWTFVLDEATDTAPLSSPDTIVSALNFSLTGPLQSEFGYISSVMPGPYNSGGFPFSPDNSVVTLDPVATSFVMGSISGVSGVITRVQSASLASEARVRVRNSAYPSSWTSEIIPLTTAFSTTTLTSNPVALLLATPSALSTLSGRAQNSLRGLNIPAGSTFSLEFYETVDNGAGADATWTNVQYGTLPGAAAGTGTVPSSVTDLGVMTDAYSTVATAFTHNITPGFIGNEVRWFKFTLPSSTAGQLGRYFHIWGEGPSTNGLDSTYVLFDASGRLLAADNDSGASFPSNWNAALTFGQNIVAPWPVNTTDLPLNGRDGDGLPAGTYYLAVTAFGGLNAADGFVVTSTAVGTTALNSTIKIVTNAPAPPADQVVTLPLNFQGAVDPFAVDRTMRYSVMQGTTTVVSSTNFTANAASQSVAITIPASVTGAVTIQVDGSQYLKRKIAANLSGSNQTLSSEVVKPGDVDNNGEVDLTDIDLIIGDYLGTGGTTEGTITDLDNNGEVDLTDIDIAIGNYLLGDEN